MGEKSDQQYLLEKMLEKCIPYTRTQEKEAFIRLKDKKQKYKQTVMLQRDAQDEVKRANERYKQDKYPDLAPFEYRNRKELNGTLEMLDTILSSVIKANELAQLPFSHYYLDHLCTTYPAIEAIAHEEKERYWKHAAEIAQHNVRLVYSIAKTHTKEITTLLDSISAGMMGLYNAIDKYDNTRQKFSTMAVPWIKQSIKRHRPDNSLVTKPAYMRSIAAKIGRITAEHPEYAEEEIQKEFRERHGEDISKCYKEAARQVILIDKEENPQLEPVAGIDIIDDLDKKEKTETLYRALETLKDRDRTIIMMRYGIDGSEGMTLKEIGNIVGLTRERIRQIEKESLEKLAQYLSQEPQHL